jgi:Tfp pilus assembly protein PilX
MRSIHANRTQQGVALVMVLMVLVVLTILGVSAMKTSVLEVRMSGNVQDSTSAFQAAESGLISAASLTFDYYNQTTATFNPSTTAKVTVTAQRNGEPFQAGRGSGFSARINDSVAFIVFDKTAVATTTSGASATVVAGFKQLYAGGVSP